VLGPSASGKSVLLEALAGHSIALAGAEVSGSVFLDGKKTIHGARDTQVALVPQSNGHLVGVLTVRECFEYSLQLKRPRMSADERKQRVDETLSALGLDVAQNTQIGTIYKRGISGGQQRRVAVGMELVYGPSITLLDEPTSGLDTTTALKTVRCVHTYMRLPFTRRHRHHWLSSPVVPPLITFYCPCFNCCAMIDNHLSTISCL
jgi:ABC-type multidrug transport system ATPase subunit